MSFQTYLGLTISSLATYLQSWAAKVVGCYNIWYDSAASEGRTGATWKPQEPEACSTPIEQGKNKTGFREVVRFLLPEVRKQKRESHLSEIFIELDDECNPFEL